MLLLNGMGVGVLFILLSVHGLYITDILEIEAWYDGWSKIRMIDIAYNK